MRRAEQGEEEPRRCMVTRSMTGGGSGARVKLRKLDRRERSPRRRGRSPGLLALPLELQLEIFAHLGPADLEAVRRVCTRLAAASLHPSLWKEIEVPPSHEKTTDQVMEELRAMSQLRKITIHYRRDIGYLLRQIARSNANLEYLAIKMSCSRGCLYAEGPVAEYLNPRLLCRIVENCPLLHSLLIFTLKFRGRKLFKQLGQMGGRLKQLSVLMEPAQFKTFTTHLSHAKPRLRELMFPLCSGKFSNRWYRTSYCVSECSPNYAHRLLTVRHGDNVTVIYNLSSMTISPTTKETQ